MYQLAKNVGKCGESLAVHSQCFSHEMTEKSIIFFGFAAGIIISAFAAHISSRLCFAVRCQARGFLLANE